MENNGDKKYVKVGTIESRVQMWISVCLFIVTVTGGFISYIKTNSRQELQNVQLLNTYSEKWQDRMEKGLDAIRKEMATNYVSKPEMNSVKMMLDDLRGDLKDIKTALERPSRR